MYAVQLEGRSSTQKEKKKIKQALVLARLQSITTHKYKEEVIQDRSVLMWLHKKH